MTVSARSKVVTGRWIVETGQQSPVRQVANSLACQNWNKHGREAGVGS